MKKILLFLTTVALFAFVGCSKDDTSDEVTLGFKPTTNVPGISFTGNTVNATYSGTTLSLALVDAEQRPISGVVLTAETSNNSLNEVWCDAALNGSELQLTLKTNFDTKNGRHITVTVSSQSGHIKPLTLNISQAPYVLKSAGMYILSEGVNKTPGTLAYYDFDSKVQQVDYFKTQNGEELGMMATNGLIYGGKMYIALDKSNQILVIKPATGILIQRVDLGQTAGKDWEPRYLAAHNGYVYASSYFGGVIKMDTTAFNFQTTPISGAYSEGVCTVNDNLYVANSGWGSGKTISIVDLNSFAETGTIDTPINPYTLKAGEDGMLYLTTLGDYYSTDAQLHKINPTTKSVTTYAGVTASRFDLHGKYAYTGHFSYISYEKYIQKVDLENGTVSDFLKNDSDVSVNVYGVDVNPLSGDVFYSEMSGKVSCFDAEGNLQYTLTGNGKYTNAVLFFNR